MRPLEEVARYRGPALIIHGTGDDVVGVKNASAFERAIRGRTEVRLVDGANHTFDKHEWEHEVMESTLDWFVLTL